MNQKARAMLQYNAYLCIFTWAVNWFVFLEWIAEKGFVIFFTVSEIEFIVDGTVISPMLSSPFCDRLLFFASRCSDLNSRRDSFLYGASFFILFPLRLLIGRDNRYVSLCPNQSVHAVWVSARTSVKLIASQHLLNGHVTRSMFLTLEEIFYIHNQK